jgi:Domain of unknown function (DUF4388)
MKKLGGRMALKGQIPDLSVSDLIMINCIGQARACVRLINTSTNTKAEIYFDNGNIIDARCEAARGLDALYQALCLKEGNYQVELNVNSPEHTIEVPWKDILKQWGQC